jgi:hypothetical protein
MKPVGEQAFETHTRLFGPATAGDATSVPGAERVEGLAISLSASIDPVRAARLLEAPDGLGPVEHGASGHRRYLSDLVFPFLSKPAPLVFRKAAVLDLGPVRRLVDGSIVVDVSWRSATLAPLFPVFGGRLLVRTDGLFLDGAYAPPFGEIGRLVDRVAFHQVAVGTARWFVGTLASQLTASVHEEAADRAASAAGNPADLPGG